MVAASESHIVLGENLQGGPSQEMRITTVRFLGREIDRNKLGTVFYGSVGFLCCINAIGLPYLMPCLRRYCGAPFLPSKRSSVDTLFDQLQSLGITKGKLVDFGSGDGRIVLEGRSRGFESVGIELNPWLVGFSRLKLFGSKFSRLISGNVVKPESVFKESGSAAFIMGNMWNVGPRVLRHSQPDVVTIYGLPGDVLSRFGFVLEESLPKDKPTYVVSNQYKIPRWSHKEIGSVNGFIIYKNDPLSLTAPHDEESPQ